MDSLDLLAVQGTLKSLLQYHSPKASILWCSAFFIVQLSHVLGHIHKLNQWKSEDYTESRILYCLATGSPLRLKRSCLLNRLVWLCVWLFAPPWTVAHQAPLSISEAKEWGRISSFSSVLFVFQSLSRASAPQSPILSRDCLLASL